MNVFLPIGAPFAACMSLQQAEDLAFTAVVSIHLDRFDKLISAVNRHEAIPLHYFAKITEQLVTGYGIAYPDAIRPRAVGETLRKLSRTFPYISDNFRELTGPSHDIHQDWYTLWGSSVPPVKEVTDWELGGIE